jgi:tetratricopeptide (TPR) repeat protein
MSQADAIRTCWENRDLERGRELYRAGGSGSEWHLYGGLILWARRDLYHAKAALEEGLQQHGDGEARVQVMLQMAAGNVYRELGDYHMATAMLREVLAASDLIPEMEAKAWYNLALTLDNRREYDESIFASDMAIAMFRNLRYPTLECMSLQNKAWTLNRLGRMDEAFEVLNLAEPLCGKPDTSTYWHQRIGRARSDLAEGGNVEALELATDIIKQGRAEWDVMSYAAWVAGHVFIRQGQLDGADKMSAAATAWAVEAKDSRCMAEASELRRARWTARKGA